MAQAKKQKRKTPGVIDQFNKENELLCPCIDFTSEFVCHSVPYGKF
jgi:hypothetical protein